MKLAFRVDAALEFGTGHVMRCLTLADALAAHGAQSSFICREHEGELCDLIAERGYVVQRLPVAIDRQSTGKLGKWATRYEDWLGADWSDDVLQTAASIGSKKVDWIVVDHYGVDFRWEQQIRSCCHRLMVIDDLANRRHDCDLLLDQNLGRTTYHYGSLLHPNTILLLGPRHALLRPEFAQWREYSLARRSEPRLQNLLITMGGVDKENVTGKVLSALKSRPLPSDLTITVVMGPYAPWLESVVEQAAGMPRTTRVLAGVGNMAQLMSESDLAIGAAGATSWERCCLGLPGIIFVLADNQRDIARALKEAGAADLIFPEQDLHTQFEVLFATFLSDSAKLRNMGERTADITDGAGVQVVLSKMQELR